MFLSKISEGQIGRRNDALDDCRQEKGKAVDWTEASHANEHEDVDLPVANSLPDVLHVEVIGKVTVVFLEATFDFFTLLWRQKRRSVRIGRYLLITVRYERVLALQDSHICTSTQSC